MYSKCVVVSGWPGIYLQTVLQQRVGPQKLMCDQAYHESHNLWASVTDSWGLHAYTLRVPLKI